MTFLVAASGALAAGVERTADAKAYSASATTLPVAEIVADTPSGVATISISGLSALASAEFVPLSLVKADIQPVHVAGADTNPVTRYDAPFASGRQFVLFRNPSTPIGFDTGSQARAFIVELSASDAPGTTLYAGIDMNHDGRPQAGEEVCQSTAAASGEAVARCAITLVSSDNPDVWVLIDVPQGSSDASYSMTLASAFPFIGGSIGSGPYVPGITATGPGHAPAHASFPLRLSWGTEGGNMPLVAQQRYFGGVMIASKGAPDLAGIVPFALVYRAGDEDIEDALSDWYSTGRYDASGPQVFRHVYIDVPVGATSLKIESGLAAGGGSVSFELIQTDFPAFSVSAHAAASPDKPPVSTWNLSPATPNQAITVPVSPGRWYIVAQTSGATTFTLSTALSADNPLAQVSFPSPPGAYYNPRRSGHGIFISQASGQQALNWYTYLEDGTPTWYAAQGALPTTSAWSAPLYRVNWDGAKVNSRSEVGDVAITPISASDLVFSWHLDGQSGSERFTRLGGGPCPTLNGVATNLNGAWYAPAQSGYGMDVVALANLQFAAFYFYDDLGIARWGSGANSPFATNSVISVTQSHGFCPVCDYVATTSQPLGALAIDYTNATAGSYVANLALQPPLSGSWSINQPIARLTGSAACAP